MSELGALILLFAIGLETDFWQLVRVGATSMTVAVVGVVLPFAMGYVACVLLGLDELPSIMAASTLTATSVGITARVLADLGRLAEPEGQIILGAAVIDDIRQGRRKAGEKIVFIHTGGTPALFAFHDELAKGISARRLPQ